MCDGSGWITFRKAGGISVLQRCPGCANCTKPPRPPKPRNHGRGKDMSSVTKTELQALARMGGLKVEGRESVAELMEAIGLLVRGRRYFRSADESTSKEAA